LLALAAAAPLAAQAPRALSLADAIGLARRNNPAWLSVQNDEEASAWAVRESYASLLPTASANGSVTWQVAGVQRIGPVDLGSGSDLLSSRYGLGVSWTLDGGSLFQVASARAGHRATEATITAGELDLDSRVTLQYRSASEQALTRSQYHNRKWPPHMRAALSYLAITVPPGATYG
jgi:outer membrane protein TolC